MSAQDEKELKLQALLSAFKTAGQCVVASQKSSDPVVSATIYPKASELGHVTSISENTDQPSVDDVYARLVMVYAGYFAQKLFNEQVSLSADDQVQANRIAHHITDMRGIISEQDIADEVDLLQKNAMNDAFNIIAKNLVPFTRLTDVLLTQKEVSGEQVKQIVAMSSASPQ